MLKNSGVSLVSNLEQKEGENSQSTVDRKLDFDCALSKSGPLIHCLRLSFGTELQSKTVHINLGDLLKFCSD